MFLTLRLGSDTESVCHRATALLDRSGRVILDFCVNYLRYTKFPYTADRTSCNTNISTEQWLYHGWVTSHFSQKTRYGERSELESFLALVFRPPHYSWQQVSQYTSLTGHCSALPLKCFPHNAKAFVSKQGGEGEAHCWEDVQSNCFIKYGVDAIWISITSSISYGYSGKRKEAQKKTFWSLL
jgi:hypothetical protein